MALISAPVPSALASSTTITSCKTASGTAAMVSSMSRPILPASLYAGMMTAIRMDNTLGIRPRGKGTLHRRPVASFHFRAQHCTGGACPQPSSVTALASPQSRTLPPSASLARGRLARPGLLGLAAPDPRRPPRHPPARALFRRDRFVLRRGPILVVVARPCLRIFLEAAADRLAHPRSNRDLRRRRMVRAGALAHSLHRHLNPPISRRARTLWRPRRLLVRGGVRDSAGGVLLLALDLDRCRSCPVLDVGLLRLDQADRDPRDALCGPHRHKPRAWPPRHICRDLFPALRGRRRLARRACARCVARSPRRGHPCHCARLHCAQPSVERKPQLRHLLAHG